MSDYRPAGIEGLVVEGAKRGAPSRNASAPRLARWFIAWG